MKLIADLHVHTIASGHAYSTIEEYAEYAKKIGLKIFAITDHGPAMPGAPHYYYFANMRMLPKQINGVRVLRGIEANIINENGDIDIAAQDMKWGELDIVLATFHPRVGYDSQGEEKNTEVLIKAMKNPWINAIAHPGNPKYPVNIKAIVEAAKENKVLIEINNSSDFSRPGSYERCVEIAKEVKRAGWKVMLGTDSHFSRMLGEFSSALKIVKEAGLAKEDIVNTSEKLISQYILEKPR
ncbi:MAG: PHP family phosphohydrolase histidinol phosphatase [Candidatus Saganbacteria bacterium]|uniref:PHP family phosphohydrolase histidinol phosphatase n=1 Tax=Candidatus Saganbacteria bacterium TaxID=2575572 RepID=A0A833L0U9_UNCSA|nr:MAG: PHP family phosphohydrolase histidinol phosphatase [Candidatus Saganbacteria bacterium]